MKYIQPKTLQIMIAILSFPAFSQHMLWRIIKRSRKISLGNVNKVVMDLERKKFVERLFRRQRLVDFNYPGFGAVSRKEGYENERVTYRLTDPIGLLRYISLFRSMNDLRVFSASVNAPSETIIDELAKEKVLFCLGTAQSRYSPYFRPERVSFYSEAPERILKELSNALYGHTKVGCYRIDYVRTVEDRVSLLDDLFGTKEDSILLTTKVQTVVDMFCDGKGAYAKPLIKELWGIEI